MDPALEEALRRVYGVAMTPLPVPSIEPATLAKWRAMIPSGPFAPPVPELPGMPEWLQRYVAERGLGRLPGQGLVPQGQQGAQPALQPGGGY